MSPGSILNERDNRISIVNKIQFINLDSNFSFLNKRTCVFRAVWFTQHPPVIFSFFPSSNGQLNVIINNSLNVLVSSNFIA